MIYFIFALLIILIVDSISGFRNDRYLSNKILDLESRIEELEELLEENEENQD